LVISKTAAVIARAVFEEKEVPAMIMDLIKRMIK